MNRMLILVLGIGIGIIIAPAKGSKSKKKLSSGVDNYKDRIFEKTSDLVNESEEVLKRDKSELQGSISGLQTAPSSIGY